MYANAEAILAVGYPWNSPKANGEIKENNPGAPYLIGWSIEQCSLGSTNSQLQHAANAASGQPSL
jgi:hypothetical protein